MCDDSCSSFAAASDQEDSLGECNTRGKGREALVGLEGDITKYAEVLSVPSQAFLSIG